MLLVTSGLTTIKFPISKNVEASFEDGACEGDIGLNTTYIHSITQILSDIVKNDEYPTGREFGSNGEHHARDLIEDWMNEIGLWTTIEPILSDNSLIFLSSFHLFQFDDNLQSNPLELTFYNSTSGIKQSIDDYYISPRWNHTIREFINTSHNRDELTTTFTETNLQIIQRPNNLSDMLNDFFCTHVSDIVANQDANLGNYSVLMQHLLNQFEIDYNISFEDIISNPSNASKIPGFTNDTMSATGDFIYIGEDPSFNPDPDYPDYWEHWPIILEAIHQWAENKGKEVKLVETLRMQKQLFEMYLWSLCPSFKGLMLYDHNNDTYNMNLNLYYPRPVLYINRTVGITISNDINNHSINYTLNQEWNESVESYNIIGQINGTNPNKTIIFGCLYDGWHNQATADAAIGIGIMLSIARYFKENNITPMYNLKFIAFGGEEASLRGAFSYEHDHLFENIPLVFDLNQLGYTQSDPRQALWVNMNDESLNTTLQSIINDTDFNNRVDNATDLRTVNTEVLDYPTDYTPFLLATYSKLRLPHRDCRIIAFLKENTSIPYGTWRLHHRDGLDHTQGDTMTYYNQNEVNATAEIILNITKYLTVSSDCWFDEEVDYVLHDSPEDINSIPDSINVSFSIQTGRPHDRVKVRALLISQEYPVLRRYMTVSNYTSTENGVNGNITIDLPKNAPTGYYLLKVFLYNFTGEIDNILDNKFDNGYYANDTTYFMNIYMGPANDIPATPTIWTGPTGSLQPRELYFFNASTTDANNDGIEYQWDWRANKTIHEHSFWQGPFPSGINGTMHHTWLFAGDVQVRVRARDIYRSPSYSNWSNPWNMSLQADCVIVAPDKVLAGESVEYHSEIYGLMEPIQNYTWDFEYSPLDGTGYYSYVQNPSHIYTTAYEKHQLLTVLDALGDTYTCEHTTNVVNVIANFTMNRTAARPNETIQFNDTSLVISSAQLTNWTWDFNDGSSYSYNRNITHAFSSPGTYNVTLTVKNNLDDTDTYVQIIYIENISPEIIDTTYSPYILVPGSNVTIYADFFDNESQVETVKINITTPENIQENYTMVPSSTSGYDYEYVFTETWEPGQYNYSIWVNDHANNSNVSDGYCFFISDASPETESVEVSTNPSLTVCIDDPIEETCNVSFYQYFPSSFVIDSENNWTAGSFSNTRTDGSGNLILANDTSPYGTGADGDLTVSSTSVIMTSNKNHRNVTINAGKILYTQGYILNVSGTLLNYGTILDGSTGGAGGSGGTKGEGQDYKLNSGGPQYATAGSTGSAGSAGSKATSGSGGRGGAGGGGGGGAWHTLTSNDADGGDGGTGGNGGKGGGTVIINVFKFNNQGVIHANGSIGSNGVNGAAGGHKDFTYLGSRDVSGGGGGGGGGGNGGDGGTVDIMYGVLINQGQIYASAGAKGNKGNGGSNQYNTYGVSSGGEGSGQSGGSGGGAGSGGAGGNGEYSVGYSVAGNNGNDGYAGSTGDIITNLVLNYVIVGSYNQTLDAGSTVEWADPVITATTPNSTSVIVMYGENTTGPWRYYDDINEVPVCRWLRVRVNLTTTNLSVSPSVDTITISTRSLLDTESEVVHGVNATYVWSGRSLNTWYYWQVRIFNTISSVYGPAWNFKTVTS